MAIYTRRIKKLGFVKNRIRDAFLISAFFLGYYTHGKVDYCWNKFEEYQKVVEVYKKQFTEPSKDIQLETILHEEENNKLPEGTSGEVNHEPRTRYSVPRDREHRARVFRGQN